MRGNEFRLSLRCASLLAALGSCGALADGPDRDKAWAELVDQAKAHGAAETKLDRSSSYVFQRPDGSYLSLTWLAAPKAARSVCLIAKDENATACVDWDSGKLTLGDRADAATPWRFRAYASLDAFEAERPGLVDSLFAAVDKLIGLSQRNRRTAHWRLYQDR